MMIVGKGMLNYIVTGTGRSGTVYMARVLTDLGIPCGHESIFNQEKDNNVISRFFGKMKPTISKVSDNYGWVDLSQLKADSSYMAVPYLNRPSINEIPVIHVVRNPFAVISSFVMDLGYFKNMANNPFNVEGHWEEWIFTHNPELNLTLDPIERACIHYVTWNERIEKCKEDRKYWFQRVEEPFPNEFFGFLGMPIKTVGFKNKKINSKKKRTRDFTADDIPNGPHKDKFLELVKRYGY